MANNNWQVLFECQHDDERAVANHQGVLDDIKCVRLTFDRLENGRKIFGSPGLMQCDFESKLSRDRLNIAALTPPVRHTRHQTGSLTAEAQEQFREIIRGVCRPFRPGTLTFL